MCVENTRRRRRCRTLSECELLSNQRLAAGSDAARDLSPITILSFE